MYHREWFLLFFVLFGFAVLLFYRVYGVLTHSIGYKWQSPVVTTEKHGASRRRKNHLSDGSYLWISLYVWASICQFLNLLCWICFFLQLRKQRHLFLYQISRDRKQESTFRADPRYGSSELAKLVRKEIVLFPQVSSWATMKSVLVTSIK